MLFSLWVNFTSGYQAVYQALVIVLLGVIIYAVLNGHRERTGQIPQPADNPRDSAPAATGPAASDRDKELEQAVIAFWLPATASTAAPS